VTLQKAEDLSHEIFVHLFRSLGSFRGESAFTTWLHRLTVNHVLMHFRKRKVPGFYRKDVTQTVSLRCAEFAHAALIKVSGGEPPFLTALN
jgi:DNA-directed RNA polymerase specialized sigma24 family protein